jgi:hypothetical protein
LAVACAGGGRGRKRRGGRPHGGRREGEGGLCSEIEMVCGRGGKAGHAVELERPVSPSCSFATRSLVVGLSRGRYFEVAMGQGQAEVAVNTLRECARNGDWLCLKNVHLAVSWLPSLEKEVSKGAMLTEMKREVIREMVG